MWSAWSTSIACLEDSGNFLHHGRSDLWSLLLIATKEKEENIDFAVITNVDGGRVGIKNSTINADAVGWKKWDEVVNEVKESQACAVSRPVTNEGMTTHSNDEVGWSSPT
jgi:hypothetical protein